MKTETAKHTKGPWHRGYVADSQFDRDATGKDIRKHHVVWQAIESPNGKRVATTGIYVQPNGTKPERIEHEEFEANARLIAAAPDLLAAAETAEIKIDNAVELLRINMPEDGDVWASDLMDQIAVVANQLRAAIQKAKKGE